jgi:hypothetical protein
MACANIGTASAADEQLDQREAGSAPVNANW